MTKLRLGPSRVVLQGDPSLRLRLFVVASNGLSNALWRLPVRARAAASGPAARVTVMAGERLLPRDEWQAVKMAVRLSVEGVDKP